MRDLKRWLEKLLEDKKVEPNSTLGDAILYMLKRWKELTLFLREPGAPLETVRARLREFREARPRGEGRTDTVCALWTAVEWLDSTPRGVGREIVLLTDGDMPHSGRFVRCDRRSRGNGRGDRSPS